MPPLSRWFIRLALLYLTVGAVMGGAMLAAKGGMPMPAIVWRSWQVHGEMMLLGWVVQLAIGVGYWILPRYPTAPVRGHPGLPLVTLIGLNVGILLAAAGFMTTTVAPLLTGRVFEFGAVVAFLGHVWPRVRRPARV